MDRYEVICLGQARYRLLKNGANMSIYDVPDELNTLTRELAETQDKLDAAERRIANAPHDEFCPRAYSSAGACDCWKSQEVSE